MIRSFVILCGGGCHQNVPHRNIKSRYEPMIYEIGLQNVHGINILQPDDR